MEKTKEPQNMTKTGSLDEFVLEEPSPKLAGSVLHEALEKSATGLQPLPTQICRPILEEGLKSPEPVARSRVLLIYSGGTLGMRRDPETGSWTPSTGFLENFVKAELCGHDDPSIPELTIISAFNEPLDSTDIGFEHWDQLALLIQRHYAEYSGFVIVHGTDTMAYTASALSFMLTNLAKPVVLTGAQIPLQNPRSDGKRNIVDAILTASHGGIPEVVVVFNELILRGCRTTKVDAWGTAAFSSPNNPPLGTGGIHLTVNTRRVRPRPPQASNVLRIHTGLCSHVLLIQAFPGMSEIIECVLSSACARGVKGIVMTAYGTGNLPSKDKRVTEALQKVLRNGLVLCVITSCQVGMVILDAYQNGLELQKLGAIGGRDMTVEAAYCKMCYLFSKPDCTPKRVAERMGQDLRGELTPVDFVVEQTTRYHEIIY